MRPAEDTVHLSPEANSTPQASVADAASNASPITATGRERDDELLKLQHGPDDGQQKSGTASFIPHGTDLERKAARELKKDTKAEQALLQNRRMTTTWTLRS